MNANMIRKQMLMHDVQLLTKEKIANKIQWTSMTNPGLARAVFEYRNARRCGGRTQHRGCLVIGGFQLLPLRSPLCGRERSRRPVQKDRQPSVPPGVLRTQLEELQKHLQEGPVRFCNGTLPFSGTLSCLLGWSLQPWAIRWADNHILSHSNGRADGSRLPIVTEMAEL
ncbi:Hypothetical predicted protein [Marmota monax]|uniref:Uncharacterized protein n=1 Tax=Marmota monax TaxID=9995 RepID=A0A5E4A5N9_MARMO|nr:Hypothetical predicted protein [Marmota monax]